MSPPSWQIWVDTGGTFTDGIGLAPGDELRRVKILSTSAIRGRVRSHDAADRVVIEPGWDYAAPALEGLALRRVGAKRVLARVAEYLARQHTLVLDSGVTPRIRPGEAFELASAEEAPVFATRLLTGSRDGQRLENCRMRLATTLGTNALLQRSGVPTALFVTRGFGDVLRIGTQQRPDLFALDIRRPEPLYDAVVEVPERLDATGSVIEALQTEPVVERARELVAAGIRSAAVALLHAYRNPRHEQELRDALLAHGFEHVSCSSELAPRIKLLTRAQTAVVDAYLAPVVGGYLQRVGTLVSSEGLLVMTSAGGLSAAAGFRPKDSLLSGPAGGVVGAAEVGRRVGCGRVISFDMGGTSTDVARIDDGFDYRYEYKVGDAELSAPALAIETVAAGGGSICWLDGRRLRVGPQSAGADPGPACYGDGGPLTLTDVNLLLGRIDPGRFGIPIDVDAAERRLDALLADLAAVGEPANERETVLRGLLDIANETMADAIRRISLRRGYDPVEYALVAFGGAGGQHACGVADRLGIGRVLVPPDAALLSALGLGGAMPERFAELQVLEPLERAEPALERRFARLQDRARAELADAGVDPQRTSVRRRVVHLRLAGQESTLEVEWSPGTALRDAFLRDYAALYGAAPEERPVEMESMRVIVAAQRVTEDARPENPTPREGGAIRRNGSPSRSELVPGDLVEGPARVVEPHSVTVVDAGWTATVLDDGTLRLERRQPATAASGRTATRPEAVRLELFAQRFTQLVREMGERVERTAVSTNVKERLDFSCALLDPGGSLVVNAPHIPVHLGALGLCVRRLTEALPLRPGDVAVTNHPAYGGSHLPDVTVVTPVHERSDGGRLIGYVASRAHHAELGGIRPGSMPPAATRLAEEGIVIPPFRLVETGRPRWEAMRALLLGGAHPTRNVEDNLADLRAAVAANHAGAVSLRKLAASHGIDTLLRYMDRLAGLAHERICDAMDRLGEGVYTAREELDDGSPIAVRIEHRDGRVRIDFRGSAEVHPGNLNATPAIVRSAVLYVLRLLIRRPLPLNEGLLRSVSIETGGGMLDPVFTDDPESCPAVVGGNVETSQRLVDTLIKALGLAACSQGTMNNLIFGNARFGYYETIGGGVGAGPGFAGASGVHTHMTNTRITDPEILEHRYPVRVERFAIRTGSGGAGRFRGGDGLIRELVFLDDVELSILSQHRVERPFGAEGGSSGEPGRQRLIRDAGEEITLGPVDGCDARRGDRLIVETPGGGGWGEPD